MFGLDFFGYYFISSIIIFKVQFSNVRGYLSWTSLGIIFFLRLLYSKFSHGVSLYLRGAPSLPVPLRGQLTEIPELVRDLSEGKTAWADAVAKYGLYMTGTVPW